MKEITVAGVQMTIEPHKIENNIQKAVLWLEKAVRVSHADLVVFPESITTGFVPGVSTEELYKSVDTIPGKMTEKICKAAKDLGVYVVFPTYERGEEKNIVYNSAALISPKGEVLGAYRKTHPFPKERAWTTPGYETPVWDTEIGKIGIVICYDGDFPELSRVIAMKGAEILVRPSAFLRSFDIWCLTNSARAYDNHVYVVAVNAVGTDAGGTLYFGNSMIVSPIAQRLAQARSQEEILFAKLDPNPLMKVSYGVDSPMIFNHLQDRNIKSYNGILQEANSPFPPFKE
ncbi:MAG: carbon-nitrogen hydrolase family protein [Candidatus Brocadiae bacterium]|nr:carbon-nitrogen hydrolase family protein [Candidatus Brocadiia bacterium]